MRTHLPYLLGFDSAPIADTVIKQILKVGIQPRVFLTLALRLQKTHNGDARLTLRILSGGSPYNIKFINEDSNDFP